MPKIITGKWVDAQNSPLSNATLYLTLSQDATASGTSQIAPKTVAIKLDTTGSIPANTSVWGNDELTPSGTTYEVSVNIGGSTVYGPENYSIAGSSPVNLNTAIPVSTSVVSNPAPVLQNPSSTQTITGFDLQLSGANLVVDSSKSLEFGSVGVSSPDTGISRSAAGTIVFGNGTQGNNSAKLKASNFNSVIWLDGINYTTLAGAYAALPSTGGAVMVPPGYTETLSANLVLSKSHAGFMFLGPATITMGTNQVTMAAGVNGAFIKSVVPTSVAAGVHGTQFVYTGTTTPFALGDSTGDSVRFQMENIRIDISGAGNSASGMTLKRIIYSSFTDNHVIGEGVGVVGNNQIAYLLDGTNNFTGDNVFRNVQAAGVWKIMSFTNGSNANTIIGFSPQGGLASGGIALDFQSNSSGNMVYNADIEGCPTAIHLSNSSGVFGNRIYLTNSQNNTTDVLADSGNGGGNFIDDTSNTTGTITLNNTNNYVNNGPMYGSTLINRQGASSSLTGNSSDQVMFTNVTVPTIPTGSGIRIKVAWLHDTGTASVAYKLLIDGSSVASFSSTGVDNSQNEWIVYEIVNNSGVQNAQTLVIQPNLRTANVANVTINSSTLANTTTATNWATSHTVNVSFNVANTDKVTPKYLIVERIF